PAPTRPSPDPTTGVEGICNVAGSCNVHTASAPLPFSKRGGRKTHGPFTAGAVSLQRTVTSHQPAAAGNAIRKSALSLEQTSARSPVSATLSSIVFSGRMIFQSAPASWTKRYVASWTTWRIASSCDAYSASSTWTPAALFGAFTLGEIAGGEAGAPAGG